MATLSDAERKVAFHTQPVWKRAATVFAGPLFNFLLTIAVLAVLFSIYGRVVVRADGCRNRAGQPGRSGRFHAGRPLRQRRRPARSRLRRRAASRFGPLRRCRSSSSCCATARRSRSPRRPNIVEQKDALGNTDQGRRDRRREQSRHLGQPRVINYQPGRRGRRGGARNRPYRRAHRPVHEAFRGRPRGQMPARRPSQDRRHGRQGGGARF